MRSECRRIPQGLNEIRFTKTIGADEHRPTGLQIEFDPCPRAEVGQRKVSDVQLSRLTDPLDGMPAELVAQRRIHLGRERLVLA